MITCAVCGAANEAEALFCGTCGNPLGAGQPAEHGAATDATLSPDEVVPEHKPSQDLAATAAGDPSGAKDLPTVSTGPVVTAPEADDGKIACAVCGTRNDPARTYCRKCASPLRPKAPVSASPVWNRRFALTFIVSAAVGLAVVLGGAALLQPPPATGAAPVTVTGKDGDHLSFQLTAGAPKPLPALPATSTIQLTSFKQAVASAAPGDRVQPPWWNSSVPRVPAISQFDGGPLQAVNCVMASGAMLARLGYGIVTTGSQLRALQDDQGGPTNYADLAAAVGRGWGVRFFRGDLTALQFRALLWAGAGVEIGVVYGALPVADRLQESFTGNHSIYVDAFRPNGADGPAAYYVMDPIGHTWAGYRGEWLPAADIEAAAKAHSAGKISATWVFAGGVVPAKHPILPRDAYPPAGPGESQQPGRTAGPGQSAAPGESTGPTFDPMPTGDTPASGDPPTGDPPPTVPTFPHPDFVTDAFKMDAGSTTTFCSVKPTPIGCPSGILGVIGLGGVVTVATASPTDAIKLLYADAIAPGTYQIIYESPPSSTSDLWFWGTSAGSTLQQADVQPAYIGDQAVSVATITLDPTASYSFVASAAGDGVRTLSTVGSLSVSP
jgi:ribosomal protein L40E